MSDQKYHLIGAKPSYFSGKVRGYLRHKKIPYTETPPSISVYRKVIVPRTGKAVVPVLFTPEDLCLQDTTCIIDYLEERFPEHSIYPTGPKQRLAALLLESYGDEWLVIPAMHYRWNFKRANLNTVLTEFGETFHPNGRPLTQKIIALAPSLIFGSSLKAKLGAKRGMKKGVEESYEALLHDLNVHFEKYPYLLGDRPSMGDYGFLGPFYGHFYVDPYPAKMLREKAPYVVQWIERMQFLTDARYGEFLPDDQIPDTLMPILKRMAREQFPVLEVTMKALDQWVKENPGKQEIKRYIGKHKFSVEGSTGKRSIIPFSHWMFQRCLDYYDACESKEVLDQFLADIGGQSAFANRAKTRVAYENYKLVVDN